MALQNQLLFNLNVPIDKDKRTINYHRPQPIVLEKCDSESSVPNVYQISQQVAEKFNAFEFVSVSTETLNTAVQLARLDMKKHKTHLPKPIAQVLPTENGQQAQKVVGHVNRRQVKHKKGEVKKAPENRRARSLMNNCKVEEKNTDHIMDTSSVCGVVSSSPPTRDRPDSQRQWMEEVVCMCEEMDCCLTKIRQLEETARNDPPRRFLVEEPGERQKRLIRIEEQKTRSTRILYTLSQKLREIDINLARHPKPAKRNHLLRQLAAISRSSIRALHEFVQHLRDFNLSEGMPRIYDNLVVLLSQIIECFERLSPHNFYLKDGKSTDTAMTASEELEKRLLGDGDQQSSQPVVPKTFDHKKKAPISKKRSVKTKKITPAPERPVHPMSLLRQKYPTAYHHVTDDAPSEISIVTVNSSSNAMSLISPVSQSIPAAKSPSRFSIRSSPSIQRPRTPSPMRITDQLEELLEGRDELPTPRKHVHKHTPWVIESDRLRRTHSSVSPRQRETRRQSPDPRYADPTISSVKKHSANCTMLEGEAVRGRKQKAHSGAKQRASSKSDTTVGLSSQEDDHKNQNPENGIGMPKYSSDVVSLRNEMNNQLSQLIEREAEKKKKIKMLLEEGKDHMDIDQLTEMILHEIMIDTASQFSAAVSDDDAESMTPTQNGVSAENILQRLDTIEAEQNQIRQRWDNLQYKSVPNKTHSSSVSISTIPMAIRLTGGKQSDVGNQPVKSAFNVKASKSVSSTTSSNYRTALETPSHLHNRTERTLSPQAAYGHSANNNNSHLVAVPMSEQLVTSIINNQRQFQRYLKRSANMKVGRFNPWKVVDEVSEEILDACVAEVCDELEQFNSDIANHIYSSEFASESSSEVPEDVHHEIARQNASPEQHSTSSAQSSGLSRNTQSDSRGHILERNWSPATGSSVKNLKS